MRRVYRFVTDPAYRIHVYEARPVSYCLASVSMTGVPIGLLAIFMSGKFPIGYVALFMFFTFSLSVATGVAMHIKRWRRTGSRRPTLSVGKEP